MNRQKLLTIGNTRPHVNPCIYMLTAPNGKIYVGSALNGFHERSRAYRNESAHNNIQNALKKYEAKNFVFSILESSKAWSKEKLQEREQFYLDIEQPFHWAGYNIEQEVGVMTPHNERAVSRYTKAGELVASFESASEAARATGGHDGSISKCCIGKLSSSGGFIWLYSREVTQQEIARRVSQAANVQDSIQRRVNQYTRAGELVNSYPSVAQAAREIGAHKPNITACCNGKQKSVGGYLWEYAIPRPTEPVKTPERARRAIVRDEATRASYSAIVHRVYVNRRKELGLVS